MLDLGIKDKGRTENYEIKYLNELVPQEEISGEIYVGEMKIREIEKKEVNEFYVIITDHDTGVKWICGFTPSYYPENGTIYGERGGRLYNFVDSLNHVVNKTEKDSRDSYSLDFETFRNSVNNNIKTATVKTLPSKKPVSKSIILDIISVELENNERERKSNLTELTAEFPQFRTAVANLKEQGKEINPETLTQEFKNLLDKKLIKQREYDHGLKEIEIWERGR